MKLVNWTKGWLLSELSNIKDSHRNIQLHAIIIDSKLKSIVGEINIQIDIFVP